MLPRLLRLATLAILSVPLAAVVAQSLKTLEIDRLASGSGIPGCMGAEEYRKMVLRSPFVAAMRGRCNDERDVETQNALAALATLGESTTA